MIDDVLLRMSIRTRGVLVFLAIAFGATWTYLFVARLVLGVSLINPLVQLPVALVPAVAAVVVRRWVTREGFADAGLRLRLRPAWRGWLLAWLGPVAVLAVTAAMAAALGWWRPTLDPVGGPAGIALLLVLSVVLLPVYWGEEFGWTSFLWPRLVPGRPGWSVLATGLVWAVWHYPLAYLGYVTFAEHHGFSMLLWTVSFVLQEVLLCWLYARSGSVWVTSLAHAGNNVVFGVGSEQLFSVDGGLGPLRVLLCSLVALTLACLLVHRSGFPHRAADDRAAAELGERRFHRR